MSTQGASSSNFVEYRVESLTGNSIANVGFSCCSTCQGFA